jgi:hypothetical protein
MSCAPCARTSFGGGLYHSHPESANAKSRAFISEAQNEVVEEGLAGYACGHAGLTQAAKALN